MKALFEAEKLINTYGITSLPVDPYNLCKRLDVEIIEENFKNLFEGMLVVTKDSAKIGINSQITNPHRKKFTCAHELGHYHLDVKADGTANIQCIKNTINSYSQQTPQIEIRANEFAAELLMPKSLTKNLILDLEIAWTSIDNLATQADVSRTVAAKKFIEHTDEACAFIVSQNGAISSFKASKNFGLFINMQSRSLSNNSVAHRVFTNGYVQNQFHEVPAQSWASNSFLQNSHKILEWTLPADSTGKVITLLWDDQGITEGTTEQDEEQDEQGDPVYGFEKPSFYGSKYKK